MIYSKAGMALALMFALAGVAQGGTPCDEVKAKIEAKIKSHGVKSFTLEAVPTAEVKDGKVVGTCEGGTKSLVYKRG